MNQEKYLGDGRSHQHARKNQLVKGELSVTSQPAGGTTIYARVPFKRKNVVSAWLADRCSCRLLAWRSRFETQNKSLGMNG
jgi:hypothetical protein